MSVRYTSHLKLPEFALWQDLRAKGVPLMFEYDVTARCNNNCRHCYINVPAGDRAARDRELPLGEIERLADEAVDLGSFWCLLTGGEPLLRTDFPEIYRLLRGKGLLVSVFTNACLVTAEHVRLFKAHPPRDLEVTVYGVTRETYERVTRKPGSYAAFRRGLGLLEDAGIPLRVKAMALRSNVRELQPIAEFCRPRTKDYFRFDALLHLRYDRDPARNEEIRRERLEPDEIAALEREDEVRFGALQASCERLIRARAADSGGAPLFQCGAGRDGFAIGYDGTFRLCSSLWHPDCIYDWREGSLREAWDRFTPAVLAKRSDSTEYLCTCARCAEINLCLWCPAHADLETGQLDAWIESFCAVAKARASQLVEGADGESSVQGSTTRVESVAKADNRLG